MLCLNQMWSLSLNTGAKMPAYGLGTWLSQPMEVGAAVEAALKAGYRHIDCAHVYRNEKEIGDVLQKCFKEGVVKREDVFITSKLGSNFHAPEDVLPACQHTMKNLQLDYLDLYLVHAPFRVTKTAPFPFPDEDKLLYNPESISQCWERMEELVSKGLVRAIGVSNFTITKTENLLKTAKIVPAVNQVECHPYFQQQKLKDYCDGKGIIFEAYSPLGNPSFITNSDPVVLDDPVIKEIAGEKSATPAQVCISFALHRDMIVIPKTVNLNRITENLKATTLVLDKDDMKRLVGIDRNSRLLKFELFLKDGTPWQEAWDIEADKNFIL